MVFYSIFPASAGTLINLNLGCTLSQFIGHTNSLYLRLIALRKAEKEEEQRAREKIRQKLEEDKVCVLLSHQQFLGSSKKLPPCC